MLLTKLFWEVVEVLLLEVFIVKVFLVLDLQHKIDLTTADFRNNILSRLRNDEVGTISKSDDSILQVGNIMYERVKRNKDKTAEVCCFNI